MRGVVRPRCALPLCAVSLTFSQCFDPELSDCAIECASSGSCPTGMICGAGRCHTQGAACPPASDASAGGSAGAAGSGGTPGGSAGSGAGAGAAGVGGGGAAGQAGDSAPEDADASEAGPPTFTLSLGVSVIGPGLGSVVSLPGGLACNTACSVAQAFAVGENVTLTADVPPATLHHWKGACVGTAPGCSVTMTGDMSVELVLTGNNYVFVTSGAWTGALGGVLGADDKCKAAASAQALPGTYRAFLATTAGSAPSRLGSARGWVRLDGLPVADLPSEMVDGAGPNARRIFYPPRVTEKGDSLDGDGDTAVHTGALPDGTASATNCADFTTGDSAGHSVSGDAIGGSKAFLSDGGGLCDASARLYCFGVDLQAPVSVTPAAGNIAFLSKQPFAPVAGGRDVADAQCAAEASGAGLAGQFVALLATQTEAATARFDVDQPYRRVDGVAIGTLRDVLDRHQLGGAPNVTADGSYLAAYLPTSWLLAWTGAWPLDQPVVAPGTSSCLDWTQTAAQGNAGDPTRAHPDKAFTTFAPIACDAPDAHVYCLDR